MLCGANVFISAIPRDTGPFYALLLQPPNTVRHHVFNIWFRQWEPYICIIFHSLSVMNTFQTWHIRPPESTAPTTTSTDRRWTHKKKPKKNNIFRIFCNRWWPENIKCWALIYTHHVSTRSDQIEIAHAQINSTAFHIQRRFTINATHRRKKKKRNKFLAYFGGQVRNWSEKTHRVYQMIIVIH